MEFSTILSGLSIISVIVGFVVQYYTVISKLQERIKECEVKSNLFWKIVETEIPKMLHSPHTPDVDILLEKIPAGTLTKVEAVELKKLLGQNMEQEDMSRKLAMLLLLARLDQIITGV